MAPWALGDMLKAGLFMRLLQGLEAFAYRKAYFVSGISRGMLDAFAKKQVLPVRQLYLPNTIVLPEPGGNRARAATVQGKPRISGATIFSPCIPATSE